MGEEDVALDPVLVRVLAVVLRGRSRNMRGKVSEGNSSNVSSSNKKSDDSKSSDGSSNDSTNISISTTTRRQ